jgi:outer membrane protein OmpA-like peptidoglycan-associated protein
MAHIPANSQVSEYTIRLSSFLLCCLLSLGLWSQGLSTTSNKALKFYEKANEYIKDRDFVNGIENYKKALKKDPGFSEAYLRLGSAYTILRELDSAYTYYDGYRRVTPVERITPRSAFSLANLYYENGEYQIAREMFEIGTAKDNQWQEDLGRIKLIDKINYAREGVNSKIDYEVKELPPSINRFYTQYFPTMTIDGQSLFFTRRLGNAPYDDEDLVVSHRTDGGWTSAESISENINTRYNEGACTISADGRMLIFTSCEEKRSFGSCDLFISRKSGDNWSQPINMGTIINSVYWESQPSLSPDGNSLYFSSNRPGGVGRRDLWVTNYDGFKWSSPRNLGSTINTPQDETTPFIHGNNQTLFFSSTGHLGFGGYDLYAAEKHTDSTWTSPKNLGYGINDHHDQLSLIVSADGTEGFFSLEKIMDDGTISSRLTRIDFRSDTLIRHKASYVTGVVKDSVTNEPIRSVIELYDLNSNMRQYQTQSDPVSGRYFFVLTQGNEYGAFVSAPGYLFEDFRFTVGENNILNPDTIDVLLKPIYKGVNLVLENIYFEFDSYELSNRSLAELQVISDFLKKNDVLVEIAGHTDQIGTYDYNQELSANRAKAVYDQLLRNGVDRRKMRYTGYGATKPRYLDPGRESENRRIEFEIIELKSN